MTVRTGRLRRASLRIGPAGVGIVQPGFQEAACRLKHLAIIGSTSSLVQTVSDHPMVVA